jgi:nicotinamidase-related amidase
MAVTTVTLFRAINVGRVQRGPTIAAARGRDDADIVSCAPRGTTRVRLDRACVASERKKRVTMVDALLVMDMQNGIVERLGSAGAPLLARVATALEAARRHSVPVIFVRVAFRDGAPEISPHNRAFAALGSSEAMSESSPATQVHVAVAPRPGEVVVVKRRVSAFAGSDLDVVLRARSVEGLILTGIATSGVVLSTTRQAADLDYRITILRDACADADEEVQRVLMDKVLARQATVTTTDQWASSLAEA